MAHERGYRLSVDPTQLFLGQAVALGGLVGAAGAYAGIVRRRHEVRIKWSAANASQAAVDRVDRHMSLARLEHTFTKSAYGRRNDGSSTRD